MDLFIISISGSINLFIVKTDQDQRTNNSIEGRNF